MEDARDLSAPDRPQKRPLENDHVEDTTAPQPITSTNSAATKTERIERNGANGFEGGNEQANDIDEPSAKKLKTDESGLENKRPTDSRDKVKGIALVKEECVTLFIVCSGQ